MLVTLAIKDLAIIEAESIDFDAGLNVLTGETGAGKSIIVGALNLVLGDRARTDAIRRGCDRAEVSAQFRLSAGDPITERLRALDLLDDASEDGTHVLVVRRVIAPGGRGRVYVNGRLTTVRDLAEIGRGLVDISSQHQHTQLLDPASHIDLLDRFGGLRAPRDAYQASWSALVAARRRRDDLRERDHRRLRREDYARFQLDEIDAITPTPGEDEALEQELSRLTHAERLLEGSRHASALLTRGSNPVDEALRGVGAELDRLRAVDRRLDPLWERVEQARIELADVAMELDAYAADVDLDPRRLGEVQERLASLEKLRRKHGPSLEEVLATAAALREEIAGFDSLELEIRAAEEEVEARLTEATGAAARLTRARRDAAKALDELVSAELVGLAMAGAHLRFALEPLDAIGPRGADAGEILIQTNVGEGEKPLARVASGGEASRVLLALKRALMAVDPVQTCIFDEVDAGTGGAVGDTIGLKLAEIAADRQVITITHLAQIAARAGHHLKVDKTLCDDRTTTRVRALSAEERHDEIARMLGGVAITERTRAHAAELLARRRPGTRGATPDARRCGTST